MRNVLASALMAAACLAMAGAAGCVEDDELGSDSAALIGSGYATARCTIGSVERTCSTGSCVLPDCDKKFERGCRDDGGRLTLLYDPGSTTAGYHACNTEVECMVLSISGDCVRDGETFTCTTPGQWGCAAGHCGTPPTPQ